MDVIKTPIILISSGRDVNARGYDRYCVLKLYADAISLAGCLPILALQPAVAHEYVRIADGLLVTGGVDVNPMLYGESRSLKTDEGDTLRDTIDMELIRAFYHARKPILGICRGLQIINVYFGGTLIQDLPQETYGEHRDGTFHLVKAKNNSNIQSLFGDSFTVNSFHHQAIRDLGTSLRPTAWSDNVSEPVIECIEHVELPILAVQWHPERMLHEHPQMKNMRKLFLYFCNQCR